MRLMQPSGYQLTQLIKKAENQLRVPIMQTHTDSSYSVLVDRKTPMIRMHFTMAPVKECGSLDKEHMPSSLDPKSQSVNSGRQGKKGAVNALLLHLT